MTITNILKYSFPLKLILLFGALPLWTLGISLPPAPLCPLTLTTNFVPVSCKGGTDGTATVTASGGSGLYEYSWMPGGQTNNTAVGLSAGTYSITVTDTLGASSCTETAIITITEPVSALVASISNTAVLCNGGNSGTATIVATGGTSPYVYSWSGTTQTTSTITGLIAGTYSVTVQDANGCSASNTTIITQPPALTATSTSTNVLCFGGNSGTGTATPSGGISVYTYSWITSPVQNTQLATGLAIGSYTVTICDANGCTVTSSVNITQPPALGVTTSVVNVSCYNYSNGSATANPTGGAPGYTYNWNTGQTTQSASNLPSGSYTVIVADANGCTISSTISITQPPALISNAIGQNVVCYGDNDGKAWVTTIGTNPPYVYAWNPSLSINDTIFGLTAGNYSVTVTDGSGCTQSTTITITQPPILTGTVSGTNSSCNGMKDGTVTVSPAGGTPGYGYLWNTVPPQNTATATGLGPGIYTIKLSDSKGCEFYATVTISEAPPIFISSPTITNETCLKGNGQATIGVIGGTSPYTYSWNPTSQTGSSITNISAGVYSVTVTDSKGCTAIQTATVSNQFSPPTAFASTTSNVSCFGANNGVINVLASAGTPGYSYNWSPSGGVGSSASNLAPGTYSVLVTDANGCTATSTTTVSQPAVISVTTSSTNASCGSNNGTADAIPSGGQAPYTYAWSNGATDATALNLAPGTYSVVVSDANGCTQGAAANISTSNPISVSESSTNISCNGDSDGTASSTPSGGSGAYNYLWIPGNFTTGAINGLSYGTYTVTVTDAGNSACNSTATVVITEPVVLNANISGVNISCNGNNNGQASSSPTGGTGPFTYNWNTGSISSSINGLSASTYSLLVTDANGCTATGSVAITQGSALLVAINTQTNVTCFGLSNGSASINASGGTGSLTYSWSPIGGTGLSASGLPANTYTVNVSDANGCSSAITVPISQPPALTVTSSFTNASCGTTDGTASVAPSGGTAPYTYLWSTGETSDSETNLVPGNYTVSISDANNCSQTQSITISVGNPIALTTSQTSPTCNGTNNGSAAVNASGGTGSYNYSWSPGGATSSAVTGLTSGTYTATVVDAANIACSATTVITLNQPAAMNVAVTPTNISCFGQTDGSISAVPSGGTPGYTYNWSPVAGTNASISNLATGTYSLAVSDENGCTVVIPTLVIEPPPLTLTLDSLEITCIGASDASIWATVGGGTPGYTYNWNPGGSGLDSLSGLGSGTYTVLVTDALGCTITSTITIPEPPPFSMSTSQKDPTCYSNNGEAYVSVSGGSGTYDFLWTPTGSTNDTITGLSPGSYQIQVIDSASGCDITGSVALAYPIVSLTFDSINVSCNGLANGIAWVISSGGAAPYTYIWDLGGGNTSTNDTVSGLSPGTYSVSVQDSNGCLNDSNVSIIEPQALSILKNSTGPACFGTSDGSGSIIVSGGTAPFTYSWSTGESTSSINSLASGTYFISVTDSNGCTLMDSIVINQPALLTALADSVNITCNGYNNGEASVVVAGGTAPFTYAWNPGAASNDTIYNLAPNIYTVTVSDNNNCTATDVLTITEPSSLTLSMNNTSAACGSNTGTASVGASGGTSPYTYSWSNGETTTNITGLFSGTYTATVTDGNGCTTTNTVQITEPNAITPSLSATDISCNGGSNGSITANVTGGTGSYLYSWSPGGNTTNTITGLSVGTYVITVTDALNPICITKDSTTITQPITLTSTMASTNITCFGSNNGTASVTPAGGTAPFTYLWTGLGFSTNSVMGLQQSTYTVTIEDANGCSTTNTVNVTEPTAIITTTSSLPASCGNTDGEVYVNASGGTGAYSYTWSPVYSTNDSLFNLLPGTYYIDVMDANGCLKKDSTTIVLTNGINTSLTSVSATCFGFSNGQASVTANGGSGSFNFLWTPGNNTNQNIYNLASGMYTVTVTDININGCVKIDSILVNQPDLLDINVVITKSTCSGGNDYIATANPIGGTPGYTYLWSFGGTAQSQGNLSPGSYIVSVTDANGCDTAVIFSINSTSTPVILPPSKINPTCNAANGSISITVFGGVPPYIYTWNPITNTTTSASNLAAGNYTVTVTDAFGCTDTRIVTLINTSLPPNVIASASPASCFGTSTGSVSAVVNAGSPPYAYLWSPSNATVPATGGLPAGVYMITITDGQACTATAVTTINQPPDITISLTATTLSCYGDSGSIAAATVTGGTPAYTYNWSSGATTSSAPNLSAGQYSIAVTDANGCTKSDTMSVAQPPLLASTVSFENITCFAGSDGSAAIISSGGTGNYSYLWNTTQTSSAIFGLSAGNYSVVISDDNSCSITHTINLTEPNEITNTISSTPANCLNTNGSATVASSGGVPPYSYLWNNGQTNATATGLSAGTYTVTTSDSSGCAKTVLASVSDTDAPSAAVFLSHALCNGGNDGSATVNVIIGTPPFTYSWNNGGTTPTITGLTAGVYMATVTDSIGCIAIVSDTVKEPPVLIASATSSPASCFEGNTGIAFATAGGGTPSTTGDYVYLWSNSETTAIITGLSIGNYSFTVTDANGCTSSASATVSEPAALTASISQSDLSCFGGNNGSATAAPTGGIPPYTYLWNNSQTTSSAINLASGNYSVLITDVNGCTTSQTVALSEPPPLSASVSSTQTDCINTNGSATVVSSDGTPGYSYVWSNGQTTATTSGLSAGTYSITVYDSNGCSLTNTVNIGGPSALNANFSSTAACFNNATVFTDLSTGATQWSWNFGDGNTSSLQDTSHTYNADGTYIVTLLVQNNLGCKDSISMPVVVNPLPFVNFSFDSLCQNASSCFTDLSYVTPGSITGWSWNFGDPGSSGNISNAQNPCYVFSGSGVYTVWLTVTTNNNCQSTISHVSAAHALPTAAFNIGGICQGSPTNLSDASTAIAGDPITTWSWAMNGGTPSSASTQNSSTTFPAAGTYTATLIVTTQKGCIDTVDKPVLIHGLPVADFGGPAQGCIRVCNTYMDSSTTADGTIINWAWTFPGGVPLGSISQNPNVCYYTPGSYGAELVVTTNFGCKDSISITPLVHVYGTPNAGFCVSPNVAPMSNPVFSFCDQWSPDVTNWIWDFGDGSPLDSTQTDPSHSYSTAITNNDYAYYTISLYVQNQYGCWDTISHPIEIVPEYIFHIPNTFTPNGDGTNDVFFGKGRGIKEFNIWLFDRWGNQIWDCSFSGNNTEWDAPGQDGLSSYCKWNGIVVSGGADMNGSSNNLVQEDVYVWKVKLTDIFDKKHDLVGHVTVVR